MGGGGTGLGRVLLWMAASGPFLSHGLLSRKCIAFETPLSSSVMIHNYPRLCPEDLHAVLCDRVSHLEEDVAALPSSLEVLCISLVVGVPLEPGALSRFNHLKRLYVEGITDISPGFYESLSDLRVLGLVCTEFNNSSLSMEGFEHLTHLEELVILWCRVIAPSTDGFHGFQHLKRLMISSAIFDFSSDFQDILCRFINITSPLETLIFYSDSNKLSVTKPTCALPYSSLKVINFSGLNFQSIEEGALNGFKHVDYLNPGNLSSNMEDILLSGLRRVHTLDLDINSSLEVVCETAQSLHVKVLHFESRRLSDSFTELRRCRGLEEIFVTLGTNHFDIRAVHFLKSTKLKIYGGKPELNLLCQTKESNVWLRELVGTNNIIDEIKPECFKCLKALERLDLSRNRISSLSDFAFAGLVHLQTLILSENHFSVIKTNTFFGLHRLETLTLYLNHIDTFEPGSLHPLRSIKQLDLGYLRPPYPKSSVQLNLTCIFGVIPPTIRQMNISSVYLHTLSISIGSNVVPKEGLDIILKTKDVTFEDCERPFFKAITKLKVIGNSLLCQSSFPGTQLASLQHFVLQHHQLSARTVDLTDMNTWVDLRHLELIRINFNRQTHFGSMFLHNLTKLESLILIDCQILTLEVGLSKDLRSLRFMVLQIAGVFTMKENFLEPMKNLEHLVLETPRFDCSCDSAWLKRWATSQSQTHVTVWQEEDMLCKNQDGMQSLEKFAQKHCLFEMGFIIFICTSLTLLLFMLVVLSYQFAGDYLLALFHITRSWVGEALRTTPTDRYQYDAFVSYSGQNERWVVEELLPNMERRGNPILRLCLHSRDFQVGKDIVENITDSLYRSRRTVCLISRHYLRSSWCSLELRLATYRLLLEHRDNLLLVFLEDVPAQRLSTHHRLARLVKTRTYLDWPREPQLQPAFWERLRAKLRAPDD